MLPDTKMITRTKSQTYAGPNDFCQIFSDDVTRLFLLSFLLTADQQIAEQCFASALQDCRNTTTVFKNWAHIWARRTIIKNAIELLRPLPGSTPEVQQTSSASVAIPAHLADPRLTAVMRLAPFERFVFVMSVLESYSDQDCRILLGCLRHEVSQARAHALQHIGEAAQRTLSATGRVSHAAAAAGAGTATFISRENFVSTVDSARLRSIQE